MENALAKKPFSVEPLDLSDVGIESICSLLQKVWPEAGQMQVDYIQWLYRENPGGQAIGFNAVCEGKVVGHYVAVPVRWNVEGVAEEGILSLNTAVDDEFRGRGLFKLLAGETYEAARKQGKRFVIGVANAQSTTLFVRNFKFQLLGPMDVKVGLGPGGKRRASSPSPSTHALYDDNTLQWRLRAPRRQYYTALGLPVVTSTLLPYVYASMGIESLPVGLAQCVQQRGLRRVLSPLRVWIGFDRSLSWGLKAFLNLPWRFRPSPLNVIFKDLSQEGRTLSPESLRMSLLDFDAY